MKAVHIRKRLESETLYLPELRPFLGKSVEIVVREAVALPSECSPDGRSMRPLAGSILRDDDPFGPAVGAEEWEANR